MAWVVEYRKGLKRVDFTATPGGKPHSVRLGRVTRKKADEFRVRIAEIVSDQALGRPHGPGLAEWVAKLPAKMLDRLRAAGLADGVGVTETTLGDFLERWFAAHAVKPQTTVFYGHTRRNLVAFFGQTRVLSSITPEDAERWRAWLVSEQQLSPATVSRRVKAARTMWRAAVRWRLVEKNPFAEIRAGKQSNDARTVFISQEVVERAIAHAPDTEWACIIALARYGGLRTPSETFLLRWQDVDWERGTIRVTVPKLERFEGLDHRVIPLFPELRTYLLKLFAEAEEGAEFLIARYRKGCINLRTQFERILRRAGVDPWPRLFHNLRGSRETELMRSYDLRTVCAWIGNSPEVAARHYATSVDLNADFRRAAGLNGDGEGTSKKPGCGGGQDHSGAGQAETPDSAEDQQAQQNQGFGPECPVVSDSGKRGYWAREDSNL